MEEEEQWTEPEGGAEVGPAGWSTKSREEIYGRGGRIDPNIDTTVCLYTLIATFFYLKETQLHIRVCSHLPCGEEAETSRPIR